MGDQFKIAVLAEVLAERRRQHDKWGEQNCSDFECVSILMEEVGEACKEANDFNFTQINDVTALPRLRQELIKVAAVACAWVEAIDMRGTAEIVHQCPPGHESLTPCCGKTPFELDPMSRITLDASLVTCRGLGAPTTCCCMLCPCKNPTDLVNSDNNVCDSCIKGQHATGGEGE